MMQKTHHTVARIAHRLGTARAGERDLPEETAVALTYGGTTQAVMMATPADLVDFAVGFTLTEGIVETAEAIDAIDIVELEDGIDVQIMLAEEADEKLAERRRRLAGPVGCGLCGIESLEGAMREPPVVPASDLTLSPADIARAMGALSRAQPLHAATRAVHAAGLYVPGEGLVAVREDVGRHNALDKLAGALARRLLPAAQGAIVLTSRVSVEMVQKAAAAGSPILLAVSAPTALAVRMAEAAGITVVAIVRDRDFEVFTHPHRITGTPETSARLTHVA
ncbi:formate dehydrogenase accessory sulfurtransferase FdhD [Afifella marina]|uniref:Sulfur carrier protein FdhD n=1 Tax=Afifella marina DSM 2698 TaxID=1120955 RepID=A0A1G5MWT4_AFIMA|nr:formate dehydrogenase accessory sulfurtransferase FdhD [Afifella marina]MBK1622118.1 sulfurtransferase FdhD [Afifella marina DSM 2698]MBK1628244.1 sulfurtransferase FdhD [Afifella marina]MBK5918902.1 sulfurtransferase FdhD [Afifella marina]RAI17763.1 sulfurtransferase FdhD [Afifella marina DSM 2698]SCZ29637.1 FdhD protein [Afifella marina DSM 2698]